MNLLGTISPKRRAQAILDRLAEERALLIAGKLDQLGPINARLGSLLTELEQQQSADPKLILLLEQVRKSASQNKGLIEASIKGLDVAKKRLAEIQSSRTMLNTYTGLGQRKEIVSKTSTHEKRS